MVAGHWLMMMIIIIIIIIMVEATSIRSLPTQPSIEKCTCASRPTTSQALNRHRPLHQQPACEDAEESSYCDFAVSQGFWDLIREDCLSDFCLL